MSNAVAKFESQAQLPEPVARRGITEPQWRTLANNLYPGAASESVLMVWDYCVARRLDPMKKPCHIVPMNVLDAKSGNYVWRDVVMPGIYEYRTTAARTGEYLGHSTPAYGPVEEFLGVAAPSFCEMTVYRWNAAAKMRAEFPVSLNFSEVAATSKDKKTGEVYINARWTRAPKQMLTKCTEAAALREAFPDELGGTHTADEMDGQQIIDVTPPKAPDPRGDLSEVPNDMIMTYVSSIADALAQDKDEEGIASDLRDIEVELQKFQELYICVLDRLAKDGIISKANWRKYLNLGTERR